MSSTKQYSAASVPFDPESVVMESEVHTRARHRSIEWEPARRRLKPVLNKNFLLDPEFARLTHSGNRQDRFSESYDDLPIHVTTIKDGVLFGQEFLVCDRLEPTLSNHRLFLADVSRITNQLDTLKPIDLPPTPVYLVGVCAPYRNFYHWCFQCLQGIALLRSIARDQHLDYRIVLPPLDPMRQRSLELLGVTPSECVTLPSDCFLSGVQLMYSTATCSDYTFQPSERLIGLLDNYKHACLASSSKDLPTRFDVSRRDAPKRRSLRNEKELAEALSKHNHSELVMSELSIEDQVSAFARAESIVAAHGAGLVNLMFTSPEAQLVEIMAKNYSYAHFFRLAQVRGMRYSQILADVVYQDANDVHYGSQMEVDVAKVIATLLQSETTRTRRAA